VGFLLQWHLSGVTICQGGLLAWDVEKAKVRMAVESHVGIDNKNVQRAQGGSHPFTRCSLKILSLRKIGVTVELSESISSTALQGGAGAWGYTMAA
jgi:hypothetical protein